jgi:exoribonuclease R
LHDSRLDLTESDLVFTIDGPGAQALDDAISFKQLSDERFQVSIHIADVATLIKAGTPLDDEAMKRGASTYVLKTFHMPMLPKELNSNKCSLLQDEPRFAVTLTVILNSNGILDISSIRYHLTIIKNAARLTYKSADSLILQQPDAEGKYATLNEALGEKEGVLRVQLKALH